MVAALRHACSTRRKARLAPPDRQQECRPITIYQLLQRFGSAAALAALPELAQRAGRQRPLVLWTTAAAERELAALGCA
jgi:DprA/Smf-like nucleotide binding protein involved in DNA uptake